MRDQRNWREHVTMIDGRQQGPVVTSMKGYRVSRVDGFTITNGLAYQGGGIYVLASSPIIANNTIRDNAANSEGGGLYLESAAPTIENNILKGNHSAYGGGAYMRSSIPLVTNN